MQDGKATFANVDLKIAQMVEVDQVDLLIRNITSCVEGEQDRYSPVP